MEAAAGRGGCSAGSRCRGISDIVLYPRLNYRLEVKDTVPSRRDATESQSCSRAAAAAFARIASARTDALFNKSLDTILDVGLSGSEIRPRLDLILGPFHTKIVHRSVERGRDQMLKPGDG